LQQVASGTEPTESAVKAQR